MSRSFPHGGAVHIVVVLILLAVTACSESSKPNVPPMVSLTNAPADSSTVTEPLTLGWSGIDSDGFVAGYEIRLDDQDFVETADTSTTLQFTKSDGSDTAPQLHTFQVRAVDNGGLAGDTDQVEFWVAIFNEVPQVWFTSRPDSFPEYAGSMVTFAWDGSDTDGQVVQYEYKVGNDAWVASTNQEVEIDFSSGSPVYAGQVLGLAHDPKRYEFSLRAQDDDGKYSTTIRAEILAGPENSPPTIALTVAPPTPDRGSVTTPQVSWAWDVKDTDGSVIGTQYALDWESEEDWMDIAVFSKSLTFGPEDGYFDSPQTHTFHLRCRDNDSTYSSVLVREFDLAIANSAPMVWFEAVPDPEQPQLYRYTYAWGGSDDVSVGTFEYAVDDTSTWTSTTNLQEEIKFTASDVDAGNCNAAGCRSIGNHTLYLRAVDTYGLKSAIVESEITTFTFSPLTFILSPTGTGGEVLDAPDSLAITWRAQDVDGLGAPVGAEMAWLEITDFASHPTPEALSTANWIVLGQVTEAAIELEPGKKYLVGIRSTDEALATEPNLVYGQNVLKVTTASP